MKLRGITSHSSGALVFIIMRTLLHAFFWVIPWRLNFMCRRLGTLRLFHLHRQVGMKYDEIRGKLEYLYGKRFDPSQTFSHINTPTFLNSIHTSYLPAYEGGTDSVLKHRHVKF